VPAAPVTMFLVPLIASFIIALRPQGVNGCVGALATAAAFVGIMFLFVFFWRPFRFPFDNLGVTIQYVLTFIIIVSVIKDDGEIDGRGCLWGVFAVTILMYIAEITYFVVEHVLWRPKQILLIAQPVKRTVMAVSANQPTAV